MSAFEVLIQEVIQQLLLEQGQGVDLGTECLRVQDKFYGVVPFLPIWEFIEGFFGEDILELLVGFGYYVLEVCQVTLPCCFVEAGPSFWDLKFGHVLISYHSHHHFEGMQLGVSCPLPIWVAECSLNTSQ